MHIRPAQEKDTNKILDLLSQVLELHAAIRPDYFIPGTTKYSREELHEMYHEDDRRIYVAVDEHDEVLGYAFCIVQQHPDDNILTDIKTLYIDDLCVDEKLRGAHIGSSLYHYVV